MVAGAAAVGGPRPEGLARRCAGANPRADKPVARGLPRPLRQSLEPRDRLLQRAGQSVARLRCTTRPAAAARCGTR
ncbi:MAG: hypothetical protein ACK559_03925, partial [bacterium]